MLDEIKRVTIAIEKSVEVVPLLVARLSIAAHGAFLGTFRFVGLYKKVLYTTV